MPEMKLGGRRGKKIELKDSESLIAVRSRRGSEISTGELSSEARSVMRRLVPSLKFDGAGITVLQGDDVHRDEARAVLTSEDEVAFAGRTLVLPKTEEPVVYTETIFVSFMDDAKDKDVRDAVKTLGDNWFVGRRLTYAPHCYALRPRAPVGQDVFDQALDLLDKPAVSRSHPEFLRQRSFRSILPNQWHLGRRVVDGALIDQSAKVDAAWAVTRGAGITIAVIDDGVDTRHPEFSQPGKIVAPFDFTHRVADALPKNNGDIHGTACAGVACAAGIDRAAGVAPDAWLMPIRLDSALGSLDESDAIMWAVERGADVISCSWGPVDGRWDDPSDPRHDVESPIPDNAALAIEAALSQGRRGKGCVVCWAAGNGNESVDLDGYASFPGVLAVAACDDRGKRSAYSDFGDSIACAFPSSTFAFGATPAPLTPGIWTTDRRGTRGYNRADGADGNYVGDFGGTSSACPGVAGAAALLLSINPMLTTSEVAQIIKETCTKIDKKGGQYDANGHSPNYGYGRVDAEAAVMSVFQSVAGSATG